MIKAAGNYICIKWCLINVYKSSIDKENEKTSFFYPIYSKQDFVDFSVFIMGDFENCLKIHLSLNVEINRKITGTTDNILKISIFKPGIPK